MIQRWFHRRDVISGQVDLHMTCFQNALSGINSIFISS